MPELKWTFQAGGRLSAPIIAADGTIYVDSEDGSLHAIEPSGGEEWAYALPGEVAASPALAADGTIYVAREKNLHALRPDGTLKWTYSGDHKAYDLAVGPDGTIYIGSDCLHALSSEGIRQWVTSSETYMGFYSLAIAHDGTVYGLTGLDVYAFSLDGALKWEEWTAPGVRGFSTSVTVSPQGDIYVNGTAAAGAQVALPIGPLDVLNPGGSFKFDRFRGEGFDGYIDSPPAIAQDGTVYVTWREVGESFITEEGVLTAGVGPLQLQARSPDATTIWSYPLGGNLCSYPVVGGDETAYVILCNGDLCALDASGNPRWRFNTGESLEEGYGSAWDLAIGDDTIYVSSGNKLFAIGEAAPTPSPPAISTPAPTLTLSPVLTPTACTQEPEEGKIAYVGWPDENIWLMNSNGSGKKQIITGARARGELTWSPDGSKLALVQDCQRPGGHSCLHIVVANADGTDRLDLTPSDSGKGYSPLASFLSWSPDGSKIAYSEPGKIYLVSTDGSNREFLMEGIMPDWSPDGTKIAYIKGAVGIYVANADGSNPVRLTEGYERDPDWSPDGNKIACASGEATYIMNSDGSNKVLLVEDGDDPRWSPDGTQIAFARMGGDMGVYVVNADGSKLKRIADGAWPAWQPNPCVSSFPTSTPTPLPPTSTGPQPITPDNAGQMVELARWDEGWSCVGPIAFSPDGQLLASFSQPGNRPECRVRLWRVSDGALLHRLEEYESGSLVTNMAFSPDGHILALGSGYSEGNPVWLWRVSDGALVGKLSGHTHPVLGVAFSPDGEILASASMDNTIRLWKMSDGTLLRTLEGHNDDVWSLDFSPDGQAVGSGSMDSTIRLWRLSDGVLLRTLEGHAGLVGSVDFSPGGKTLVSGATDETVRLWRVSDGKLLRTLEGHTGMVSSVAFSPDGQTVVSGSWDRSVRLWRVSDGKLLRTLEGHTYYVDGVAFSPDGRLLASGAWDGTIRLWGIRPEGLVQTLPPQATPVGSPASTPTPRPLNPLPNCPHPNACITYPRMGDWISGVVPLKGSADVPDFQYYKFEYRPVGEEAWRFLVRFDQPVAKGTLMEWHTHTVPKGEYELRLTVIDRGGNYPEPCVVRVRVY